MLLSGLTHMSKIRVSDVLSKKTEAWLSEVVGRVNSNRVNARVMVDIEAQFHLHQDNDEFFLVLNGEIEIVVEDQTILLAAGESYTVGAGLKHRARAKGCAELITVISENA